MTNANQCAAPRRRRGTASKCSRSHSIGMSFATGPPGTSRSRAGDAEQASAADLVHPADGGRRLLRRHTGETDALWCRRRWQGQDQRRREAERRRCLSYGASAHRCRRMPLTNLGARQCPPGRRPASPRCEPCTLLQRRCSGGLLPPRPTPRRCRSGSARRTLPRASRTA